MFILIRLTQHVSGHHYAHHQEKRLCKQLHVEYAWLCWLQSCRLGHELCALFEGWYTGQSYTIVVYIVCSPDDGHNDARNMLS